MQIDTQDFQLPQYQSNLLKKQQQSKVLSPKVTQICPQIKETLKFRIKKHHLDDSEAKLALQYDYDQSQQPHQYVFQGDRLQYNKNDYQSQSPRFNNSRFSSPQNNNLKLNSEYFQSQARFNIHKKPQRDVKQDLNDSSKSLKRSYNTQNPEPRLKKSISVSDYQKLKRNQAEMQNKVFNKLNVLENQNEQIKTFLKTKQKSAQEKPMTDRYKSETKRSSVQKDFKKLKQKLQKQRIKQKQRLENQLRKIKQYNKKINQEQKMRKKSFKQIMYKKSNQHTNIGSHKYMQNLYINGGMIPPNCLQTISSAQNINVKIQEQQKDNLIRLKLMEIQKKYLPKTNIVNKRIQCDIYDPKAQALNKLQNKPKFQFNDQSDTDSQFSDY